MNLHEFQAKALLRQYGIAVPKGAVVTAIEQLDRVVEQLDSTDWIVKAQIHAGGRGKAGGVRRVSDRAALQQACNDLLGTRLVTAQSGAFGKPVDHILVEKPLAILQELYLSILVDREHARTVIVASRQGGMEIEQVASQSPDSILTALIDPVTGLLPYHARRLAFGLGLAAQQKTFSQMLQALYRLFIDNDLSLLEINPLVVTEQGLVCADAKINIDDNALFRHAELLALRDIQQEDSKEAAAHEHGLNYVALDGDIACMVNGAGLAMATMDLIKLCGGEPANFLDVGGGTTAAKVAEAFKIILSEQKVRAILVNIFGGIVRCDLIADGIIQAVQQVQMRVPVVVRLEGTNVEQGRARLLQSGLAVIPAEDLADAAQKAVAAARGGR